MTGSALAEKLDVATRAGEESRWLEGLRCIDPSIELIRTFTIDQAHRIYIRKQGQKEYHNLSQMGDAVFKILEILANTSQNEDGYLLIDEVENGIHYTHHQPFWETVFRLCQKFRVQVFATSHSLEMIRAFHAVALANGFEEDSRYFEIFRSARTGEIVANALSLQTLAYCLENGLSFRGEDR
jgi:AAA15 family ATPase/GTPase